MVRICFKSGNHQVQMVLEGRSITLNKFNLPVNKASAIPGVSGKQREEIIDGIE